MRYFTNQKEITSIKRHQYSGSPDGSTRTEIATTGSIYLRPLSEEQSIVNEVQFGQGYMGFVDEDLDIQESDEITVDGQTYEVKGMAHHDRGFHRFKRLILTKPSND